MRAEGTAGTLVPHRVFEGNRPSSTLLLDELTPAALDALVADACEAAAVNSDKDAADKAVADLYAMRAAAGI